MTALDLAIQAIDEEIKILGQRRDMLLDRRAEILSTKAGEKQEEPYVPRR